MDPRITFVIFDMDDVLASLDRPRRLAWLSGATGKPPAHFDATVWRSDFEPAAEAGAYGDPAEYLAEFNRRSGCALTRAQWVEARRQAMTPIPGTLVLARALAQVPGLRTALLTNNGSLLKDALPELFPEVVELFGERAHVSCEFGARKPDPRVFLRLLERYQVPPAEALMIDDDPRVIEGAREAGLHGLVFEGPGRLRGALEALGVLPQ